MAAPSSTFHLRAEGEMSFGYSQARRVGNTLYISGSLSVNDRFEPQGPGDMAAQVRNVYDAIEATLAAFGASLSNIVKENIFVTDMAAFLEANAVRVARYKGGLLPAVTAVEVRRLAFEACLVEIESVAEL
jgi:enamine deaminase RidA (YjgF/YER057c/UK114 family)